jgi:p-methyltransferase
VNALYHAGPVAADAHHDINTCEGNLRSFWKGHIKMSLDAIIISDFYVESLSGSNPLRLTLDNKTADIQVVLNYIENKGKVVPPIVKDNEKNWAAAPRLNGLYLLNYLVKNNFEIELINNFYEEEALFTNLLKRSPRAVIVSTTFIYSKKDLHKLVAAIRRHAPDIHIIVGGPFVYKSHQILNRAQEPEYNIPEIRKNFLFFSKNEPLVDLYIISLKGEKILGEALRRLKDHKALDGLPNTARFTGTEYVFNKRIDDIDGLENNFMEWKSMPDSIFQTGVIPMQASIGCPYHCAFCNFTKDKRLILKKPLEQLIDELNAVAARKTSHVWFVDDNFRLGGNDLNSVFQRFVDEPFKIEWMSFFRADALQNVDADLLRRSGCKEVRLGLESADLTILKNMNKRANPDVYKTVIKDLLRAGINCSCYFIFGFPGETEASAERTLAFIKEIEHPELDGVLSWSIYPFMLVPLSPIYEKGLRYRYDLNGYLLNWKHNTMDSNQAKDYVKKAFFELENSGPIYRGDNFDLLDDLSARQRKAFNTVRHEISKRVIRAEISPHEVISKFSDVLLKPEGRG